MKDDKRTKRFIFFVSGLLVFLTIAGLSFAYFTATIEEGSIFSTTGKAMNSNLRIRFTENQSGVSLSNTYPMPNQNGLELDPYTFTVTNEEKEQKITIAVVLEVLSSSTLSDELINISLNDNIQNLGMALTYSPSDETYRNAYKIDRFDLEPGESMTKELRTWINENGTVENAQNKTWSSRILIIPTVYEPSLIDEIIASSKGKVTDFNQPMSDSVDYYSDYTYNFISSDDFSTHTVVAYADSYSFDTSTGLFFLENAQICEYPSCYSNLIGKYISFTDNADVPHELLLKIEEGTTLNHCNYRYVDVIPNYSDSGVYEMEDDYGTSYYYRGSVENNNVFFADNYWKILRVNGDKSLRLILDGRTHSSGGIGEYVSESLQNIEWNEYSDDVKYAGYMFGGELGEPSTSKSQAQTNETDSNIKTVVDAWYKENIVDTGKSQYVSDTLFCNDREVVTDLENSNGGAYNNGDFSTLGYGNNYTVFMAESRLGIERPVEKMMPKLTCTQKNDAFTVYDTIKGNGALTYPVGLITADEGILAGLSTNNIKISDYDSSFLVSSVTYYTMTPSFFENYMSTGHIANDFLAEYSGGFGFILPVINLKYDYVKELQGTGTWDNPYTIEELPEDPELIRP